MAKKTFRNWLKKIQQTFELNARKLMRWVKSRKWRLHDFEDVLSKMVSVVLRVGTLLLIIMLLVFVFRLFKDEGYLIQAFSVPQNLTEGGYTGAVIARRLQDEVVHIKEDVNSVKQDSVVLLGEQEPELDLAVMGIGLSINSVTYHLRKVFGYHSKTIRGDITRLDDEYTLHLRMTGYPKQERKVTVVNGNEVEAIDKLMQRTAEAFLENTDPYRLAVYCYHQDRYDESMRMIRKVLYERPDEHHWAYLAWGGVLIKQNYPEAAIRKFRKAIEVKPDFTLAWRRLAWALHENKQYDEAREAMTELLAIEDIEAYIWANMGWLVNQQKYYHLADSFFQKAQRLEPNNPQFLINEADSKFSRGENPERAVALLKQADSLMGSGSHTTTMLKSFLAIAQGDTMTAAINAYETWDLDPDNPDATNLCIRAAHALKDFEKIRQVYNRKAWKDFNDYQKQQFLNRMAMTYNELGMIDSAMNMVTQAIAVNEAIGYPYSTLAEVYAMQNDIEKFYEYLELAFIKGMGVAVIENSDLEPYISLKGNYRYEQLLDKYRVTENLSG